MRRGSRPFAAALVLVAAACGEAPEPAEAPGVPGAPGPEVPVADPASPLPFPVSATVSGELILTDEGVAFLPCGADTPVPLRDRTGDEAARTVAELGYGEGRVLAAVVMDDGDLLDVRHAVPEGRGCPELLPDADLVARGNEPFWALRIRGDEALWMTPDDIDGVVHSPAGWERDEGEAWTLHAPATRGWDGRGPGGPLLLRLIPERCVDTMSGARFPFTARVERDGEVWAGCAVEGRHAARHGNR
jgi:uncharacterized membrane protein